MPKFIVSVVSDSTVIRRPSTKHSMLGSSEKPWTIHLAHSQCYSKQSAPSAPEQENLEPGNFFLKKMNKFENSGLLYRQYTKTLCKATTA